MKGWNFRSNQSIYLFWNVQMECLTFEFESVQTFKPKLGKNELKKRSFSSVIEEWWNITTERRRWVARLIMKTLLNSYTNWFLYKCVAHSMQPQTTPWKERAIMEQLGTPSLWEPDLVRVIMFSNIKIYDFYIFFLIVILFAFLIICYN